MLFYAASECAASIVSIYPMGYVECNRACWHRDWYDERVTRVIMAEECDS